MPFDSERHNRSSREPAARKRIAVIGAGISGLSAAWLLSHDHDVVIYEEENRLGGHANTVETPVKGGVEHVDCGFIVFNKANYPNFTALLNHLDVGIEESCMSFGVSMQGGQIEYSGQSVSSLFAAPRSYRSRRHWQMLGELLKFHRVARQAIARGIGDTETLQQFIHQNRLSDVFAERFLRPFAAAIWSAPAATVLDYPAGSFLRFFANHGLLQVLNMPIWNTVRGGSKSYVDRLAAGLSGAARLGCRVQSVKRSLTGIEVHDETGACDLFDDVLIATHGDIALSLLDKPTQNEARLLSAFRYQKNYAVLHKDPALMPVRKCAWSSWNYLGGEDMVAVTYWMNRLQNLKGGEDIFVTLNPSGKIREDRIVAEFDYTHPIFDLAAGAAQKSLSSIQGESGIWYAGAHFGQGFHEDGLQAGLHAAELMGARRRPWDVENESGRIYVTDAAKSCGASALAGQ